MKTNYVPIADVERRFCVSWLVSQWMEVVALLVIPWVHILLENIREILVNINFGWMQ